MFSISDSADSDGCGSEPLSYLCLFSGKKDYLMSLSLPMMLLTGSAGNGRTDAGESRLVRVQEKVRVRHEWTAVPP